MSEPAKKSPANRSVVNKSLIVSCPRDHAFAVFTQQMGQWWPAPHHIGKLPFKDVVIEQRTGGRWYEIDTDGNACEWGHVLAWEPPHRLVLSWHLDVKFEYHPEMERSSEIELRFIEIGPQETRIQFEHRCLERHGDGFEGLRDELDGGWIEVLGYYTKLAACGPSKLAVREESLRPSVS